MRRCRAAAAPAPAVGTLGVSSVESSVQCRVLRAGRPPLRPVVKAVLKTGGVEFFISSVDVVEATVHALKGFKFVQEKGKQPKLTHVILGEKRRTMKLLMAIANGPPVPITARVHSTPQRPFSIGTLPNI
eukprot:460968-Prorocentrum_minimum.AAC.1